ncbi:MAG: biopolymer transporter ExbD [Gammaproteobacteria bacterium]|nr:MAG: biopolymer transporter ExbD [Gammaproteobacteria bacterium]
MKMSMRAKRLAKHRQRLNSVPRLNLVPLIDCFVLLIFFLLINYSSNVEVLNSDKSIKLPASVSENKPGATIVISVSATEIIVAGQRVGSIEELMASTSSKFAPLEAELKNLASQSAPLTEAEKTEGRPVTIMGDRAIPYEQLKKIMATCVAADYRKIALAVTQTAAGNKAAGG